MRFIYQPPQYEIPDNDIICVHAYFQLQRCIVGVLFCLLLCISLISCNKVDRWVIWNAYEEIYEVLITVIDDHIGSRSIAVIVPLC